MQTIHTWLLGAVLIMAAAISLGSNKGNMDRIVYERWLPHSSGLGFQAGELWSINQDGTDRMQLTTGETDQSPSWSPNRTHIAFSRHGSGIWVLELETLALRQVSDRHPAHYPAWISENTLVFSLSAGSEDDFGQRWRLYQITLGEGEAHILDAGAAAGVFLPLVSPSRKMIAFHGNKGVFVAETSNLRGTQELLLAKENAYPEAWLPGEKELLVIHDKGCTILSMSGDARSVFEGVAECNASWSPGGRRVAFQGEGGIWVANSDGTKRQLLVRTSEGESLRNPVWR